MQSTTRAIVLGAAVWFTTRDPMATLVAGGGSLLLDRVNLRF